ncbi:MAG TPA: adenosylmethionine decarboxylase, partial [Polyangiaceae bacterium]|nr:adenosylmethionine decarboxylase [Polyangiaceae bacterium]
AMRRVLHATAKVVRATVVGEAFHHFAPQGVSGTLVIAESHISLHTWPEQGYVAVDIFTCGELDPNDGVETLAEQLKAASYRLQEITRGLPSDIEAGKKLVPQDVRVVTRLHEARPRALD